MGCSVAGNTCDELTDLGGWKSRVMVDRYAKFSTKHLAVAASRIRLNVTKTCGISHVFASFWESEELGGKLTL